MNFNKMKIVKVRGKEFIISIHYNIMEFNITELKKDWFCAYVLLKEDIEQENLEYCTYKEKVSNKLFCYGVDTNHHHNWEMTREEKYKDAIMQIKRLIGDYLKGGVL